MSNSDSAGQKTPRYRFWRLYRCNLNFRGREAAAAAASMTSEAKTEARFRLGSPDYLLGPVIEAVIGVIKQSGPQLVSYTPTQKNPDNCPVRPAGSATGNTCNIRISEDQLDCVQ